LGREGGQVPIRVDGQVVAAALRDAAGVRSRAAEGGARPAGSSLFNQVLDQVVAKARLETAEGLSRLTVQLKPEFLGRMQIQTDLSRNEGLHAVIRVENPAVRKAVEASLPSLLEKLAEAGLKVESAEVTDLSAGNERWTDRKGENANLRGGKRNAPPPPEEVRDDVPPDDGPGDGMISYFA
jgi:flagellar hook-length control protein FliK